MAQATTGALQERSVALAAAVESIGGVRRAFGWPLWRGGGGAPNAERAKNEDYNKQPNNEPSRNRNVLFSC